MKKIVLSVTALFLTGFIAAQDLATKIPYDASVVVTVKGKNITDLMSVVEFENSEIGKMLIREISRETDGQVADIEGMGLNLNANMYYFLETKEGVYNNVFLIPMEHIDGFQSILSERDKEQTITEGGISYFQEEYDDVITMWNSNTLMVVVSKSAEEEYSYYDDYGYYDDIAVEATPAEVVVEIPEVSIEEPTEEIILETVEEEIEETVIESTEIEETVIESTEDVPSYYESPEYKKQEAEREKRYQEREAKRVEKHEKRRVEAVARAKQIINGTVGRNILKNSMYVKSIGKGEDELVVWVNDFSKIYKNIMPYYLYGATNPYDFMNIDKFYKGMTLTGKLNFEEDQVSLKYDYTMNDELAELYKPMYKGKFNKNFLNYINEDKLLGYISLNMSTEGTLQAYPELMDKIFKSSNNGGEEEMIADAAKIVTRLFSLLIDEEGAAKIIRGDMMFLVTDLREREFTYTDYEYDQEYNYKEVQRTKTETLPDFLFMFSSEEQELFRRLMKIGMKEAEITYENGLYVASQKATEFPLDIYFMFKDDVVFVGSSKEHLMGINNNTYVSKVSSGLRKDISKNVTSVLIKGGEIATKVPSKEFPRAFRNEIDLLTNSEGNFKLNFSKIKGNSMTGEVLLKTPAKNDKNSLSYFINMFGRLAAK